MCILCKSENSNYDEKEDENGNDSPPALGVPKDKEHSKCVEEILSLENLFPAPLETKDEFEVIKMHAGDEDHNYARIFFEFNNGCSKGDVQNSKQALEHVKKNGGELKEDILKNVKRVVVDRTKIDGYSQGKANDEIIFNEDNELISVRFVEKPENDQIKKGQDLRENTVYNKVMVLKYNNKYLGPQAFIVDMDNNLIITTDDLKLYCHSKDNGTGFDDNETPVYISSSTVVPMYHRFRINNAIKFANVKSEDAFYQKAIKQLDKNRSVYGINYNIYSEEEVRLEGMGYPYVVASKWATNVGTFVTSQVKEFNEIINEELGTEEKKQKIQTFCNSFKDYLLGHKKNNDGADKKDNKKYDNIIMVSDEDYDSVDALLSCPKVGKEEDQQKQVEEIIYPVFEQITKFIKQIKKEVKKIEKSETNKIVTNIYNEESRNNNELKTSTIQQHSQNNNYGQMKIETDEQKPPTCKCDCGCDFGLPDCLKNFLGK